jgi:hypothetical protein
LRGLVRRVTGEPCSQAGVALRPVLENKRGNRQRKAACINRIKRDDRMAVTRNTAIESEAHKPARKQSTKGDRENNKRCLSRHHACKRCHASKRGCEEKSGVLGPDFVVAAGFCLRPGQAVLRIPRGAILLLQAVYRKNRVAITKTNRSEHEASL